MDMQAVLTGLIAVVGALLGSVLTHVFQRRTANRTEQFARQERLQQERLSTYSAFAQAAMEYRRGQYDRWHRHQEDPTGSAYIEARTESYRLRAVAEHAMFRVQLLAEDPELVKLASVSVRVTADLHHAGDTNKLKENGERARQVLEDFVVTASAQVLNAR